MGAHLATLKDPRAKYPDRVTHNSVGYDLYAMSRTLIKPHDRAILDTGIQFTFAPSTYGQVVDTSSLIRDTGLHVGAGVIDPDYTGTIKVLLINTTTDYQQVEPGQRIAQLMVHFLPNFPLLGLPENFMQIFPLQPPTILRGDLSFGEANRERIIQQAGPRINVAPINRNGFPDNAVLPDPRQQAQPLNLSRLAAQPIQESPASPPFLSSDSEQGSLSAIIEVIDDSDGNAQQ
jgi:dUTP pyrophosphatase